MRNTEKIEKSENNPGKIQKTIRGKHPGKIMEKFRDRKIYFTNITVKK